MQGSRTRAAMQQNQLVAGGMCQCMCPVLHAGENHGLSWDEGSSLSQPFQEEGVAVAQVSVWGTARASWFRCGMGHALPPVPPESAAWPLAA